MRTLTLLTALLLLALQTQAEPLNKRANELLEQDQLQKKEEVMFITFKRDEGDKSSAVLQGADVLSGVSCTCRTGDCVSPELLIGVCLHNNEVYRLCCRR